MREIDQIVGLRSKLGFHLLGNPHRPIPPPHGSWSGGPLPPAGRRPPIALPLPPRFPVWRQKWESPNPVEVGRKTRRGRRGHEPPRKEPASESDQPVPSKETDLTRDAQKECEKETKPQRRGTIRAGGHGARAP